MRVKILCVCCCYKKFFWGSWIDVTHQTCFFCCAMCAQMDSSKLENGWIFGTVWKMFYNTSFLDYMSNMCLFGLILNNVFVWIIKTLVTIPIKGHHTKIISQNHFLRLGNLSLWLKNRFLCLYLLLWEVKSFSELMCDVFNVKESFIDIPFCYSNSREVKSN